MSSDEEKNSYLFGVRLREERERLKLSQSSAGSACGVSREMWGKYERGESLPGGEVLFSFASIGANLHYIATGSLLVSETSAAYSLRPDQKALLDNFEHCSEEDKSAIKRMAFLASKEADNEEKPKPPMKHSA